MPRGQIGPGMAGRNGVFPSAPASIDPEELLDWDVWLDPPPRPERTIQVRLEYAGRDRPIPFARFFMRIGLPTDIPPFTRR